MSKTKQTVSGWTNRFALIDHYKPTDEQACSAFGVSKDELNTARDMRSKGKFQDNPSIDVNAYASLFSGKQETGSSEKKSTSSTHTKPKTTEKPETATRAVKEPKKRGRKGDKISKAFQSIPSAPTPVEEFAQQHNVSIAVLRQSRRFDSTGLPGAVKVKKDKETKQLMIWRETD